MKKSEQWMNSEAQEYHRKNEIKKKSKRDQKCKTPSCGNSRRSAPIFSHPTNKQINKEKINK